MSEMTPELYAFIRMLEKFRPKERERFLTELFKTIGTTDRSHNE